MARFCCSAVGPVNRGSSGMHAPRCSSGRTMSGPSVATALRSIGASPSCWSKKRRTPPLVLRGWWLRASRKPSTVFFMWSCRMSYWSASTSGTPFSAAAFSAAASCLSVGMVSTMKRSRAAAVSVGVSSTIPRKKPPCAPCAGIFKPEQSAAAEPSCLPMFCTKPRKPSSSRGVSGSGAFLLTISYTSSGATPSPCSSALVVMGRLVGRRKRAPHFLSTVARAKHALIATFWSLCKVRFRTCFVAVTAEETGNLRRGVVRSSVIALEYGTGQKIWHCRRAPPPGAHTRGDSRDE